MKIKNKTIKKIGGALLILQDRFNLGKAKFQMFMGIIALLTLVRVSGFTNDQTLMLIPFLLLGFILTGLFLHSTGIDEKEQGIKSKRNPEFKKLNKKMDLVIELLRENKNP